MLAVHEVKRKSSVGNRVSDVFEVINAIKESDMTLRLAMFDICKLFLKPATGLLARRPIAAVNGELAAPVLHLDNGMGLWVRICEPYPSTPPSTHCGGSIVTVNLQPLNLSTPLKPFEGGSRL